jgi:hypothetical protein
MTYVLTERLIAAVDHFTGAEHRHDFGITITDFIDCHLALGERTVTTPHGLRPTAGRRKATLSCGSYLLGCHAS